jgi:hypothetical protein
MTVECAGGGTLCGCFGKSAGGRGVRACVVPGAAGAAGEDAAEVPGAGGIQSSSSDHSFIAGDWAAGVALVTWDFLRRTKRTTGTMTIAPMTPTIVKISNGSRSLLVSAAFSAGCGVAAAIWGLDSGVA